MTAGSGRQVRVLLVEDDPDDALVVERYLRDDRGSPESGQGPVEVAGIERVGSLADGLHRVREDPPDVVLLDLQLPDSSGLATVDAMVEHAPRLPIVVLTGREDGGIGVEAIQRGAQDYLRKGDLGAGLIRRTLRYAVERERNQRELRDRTHRLAVLNRIVRQDLRNDVSMIVGRADQLRGSVAPSDEPVLEALLDAARHAVDLVDTAGEVVDALSADGLDRSPRDLDAVLDAAVARLRAERDVEVAVRRDDVGSVTVYGSPMLESAFKHLLATAVDFADDGGGDVGISVETAGEQVSVAIARPGEWLSEPHTALLDAPDAALEDATGIGVGLYLVRTVLEAVGGDVAIEEGVDGATTVTVRLERVAPE